jgi:hypothetical protein
MPDDKDKLLAKLARNRATLESASRLNGTQRNFASQVSRDGDKEFTGYPKLPSFSQTDNLHPTRIDQHNNLVAAHNSLNSFVVGTFLPQFQNHIHADPQGGTTGGPSN